MKKNNKFLLFILLFAAFVLLSSGVVSADVEETGPNIQTDEIVTGEGDEEAQARGFDVNHLVDAFELIDYGREESSPLAIITAVAMIANIGHEEGSETPEETSVDNEEVVEEAEKGKNTSDMIFNLLEEVKIMAQDEPVLLAVIEKVQELVLELKDEIGKGAVNGPTTYHYKLKKQYVHTWNIDFNGGEYATVQVQGDGASDLNLYIYDEDNNLIALDASPGDYCYTSWYPRWTGSYKIQVVNAGDSINDYYLVHN